MKRTIPLDRHVFVTGQTGTGKSYLVEMYLRGYEHVVKLDTKGEVFERRKKGLPVWEGLREGKDYTVIYHLADIDDVETKKIIYAPDFEEQEMEYYDALMKWVYRRENTILWIDELMEVCPNAFKYPPYLKGLLTRGRSKEAVVWCCTQRPSDIPAIVLGNSDHFFVFDQNLPQDRKKLCEVTGSEDFMKLPGFRNFWYFERGWSDPILATLTV
ncbi:DUF87 domain-containing protein [Bacillus sp. AFS075034]|uniref:DUF87 domain-containing protein n=1 Tax=Bacillus sp. AFS075034 TaxID=2034281 RepID=UPI000BFA2ED0|nr:DUF87 domain-containing protein [Bacillus sp. AFS075034]PFW63024.1 hypothetical protein COL20_10410 [Bacillus sp. AFS075034]